MSVVFVPSLLRCVTINSRLNLRSESRRQDSPPGGRRALATFVRLVWCPPLAQQGHTDVRCRGQRMTSGGPVLRALGPLALAQLGHHDDQPRPILLVSVVLGRGGGGGGTTQEGREKSSQAGPTWTTMRQKSDTVESVGPWHAMYSGDPGSRPCDGQPV